MDEKYAIKLFDLKSRIEMIFNSNSYKEMDNIKQLKEYINEFQNMLDKLKSVDDKIKEEEKAFLSESELCFFIDKSGETFISDDIKEYLNTKELYYIEKSIHDKKSKEISNKKIKKGLEKLIAKKIFIVRSGDYVLSFVIVHSKVMKKHNIMIITATTFEDYSKNIETQTYEILKHNKEEFYRQINQLEKNDAQYMGIQSLIRDEFSKLENGQERYEFR